MSKRLCKEGEVLNKKDKKFRYECKKCGMKSNKEESCCKPIKIIKEA